MPHASILTDWVADGEGDRQEFKKSTAEQEKGLRTLCGFLNHRGGRVLFGVSPAGKIVGQGVSEGTLEKLAADCRKIEPPVNPRVDTIPVGDKGNRVICVEVDRGPQPPYRYAGISYVRRSALTDPMPGDEYERTLMERLHSTSRWEIEPADGWTADDLDGDEILRTLNAAVSKGRQEDPGTRDVMEVLRGFGLVREGCLLRAAVVLFGREDRLLPGYTQCRLRVARFRGTDKSEATDERQFHGHAFRLLGLADKFLRETLPVAGRVVPNLYEREDDPLYPPSALREALANALCHREYDTGGGSVSVAVYDDRLEITSSGRLHFGLTPADLLTEHDSRPWNPSIAVVFYRRGLIETWGGGTLKMVRWMKKAGLPAPEFEEQPGAVVVRFRPSSYLPPEVVNLDLTARQRVLLELLGREGRLSPQDIMGRLKRHPAGGDADDLTRRVLQREMQLLRDLSLIDFTGRGPGVRWFLVDAPPRPDAAPEPAG